MAGPWDETAGVVFVLCGIGGLKKPDFCGCMVSMKDGADLEL